MRIKDMLGALQLDRKKEGHVQLMTRWGKELAVQAASPDFVPLPEYPRPQFVRDQYTILNGWWECRFGSDEAWQPILVPFSPETVLSGVGRTLQPDETLYYRRTFTAGMEEGQRLLLHFGAVDQECRVHVNGQLCAEHVGGYLPFEADITEAVREGDNLLEVEVRDRSDTGRRSRGKQKLAPGGMWYTAQSGIWQTVWMERVPQVYIQDWALCPQPDKERLKVRLELSEEGCEDPVRIEVWDETGKVAEAPGPIHGRTASFDISIPQCRLWSPQDPFLYTLKIEAGADRAEGYAAMRSFTVEEDEDGYRRFCLNHQPVFLNGVLDQGYWPESLMTPPCDEAMQYDILEMQSLGFNVLRKHCKIEPLRWYAHCDRCGMLVWQDMVNGGLFNAVTQTYLPTVFPALQKDGPLTAFFAGRSGRRNAAQNREWIAEMKETVRVTRNIPSLACRTLFNEGWGQFDTRRLAQQLKKMDPQRLVDAASGWFDAGCGDFAGEHNYFRKLKVPEDQSGRLPVISEYGGLTLSVPGHTYDPDNSYGYGALKDAGELRARLDQLRSTLRALEKEGLAGAVYTQVSDIQEEINGLLTYDRERKLADPEHS